MSKNQNNYNPHTRPAARKLAKDLADLNSRGQLASETDGDMVSLIVDGILRGEDISRRYPTLYRKLLENAGLRQALMDALESVEAERAHQMIPLPKTPKTDLSFLLDRTPQPLVEILNDHKWRGTWRRTLEQIQAIFSPPELAYRADPTQFEDPWFTLLRDELEASGAVYTVALECTLSSQTDEAISAFLNLAVTLSSDPKSAWFPLQAVLHWGAYTESIIVPEEGRTRFPDIPLTAIMDIEHEEIRSGLSLILEKTA